MIIPMKYPIKPQPPVEPIKPRKYYEKYKHRVNLEVTEGMSLKSFLDNLKDAGIIADEDTASNLHFSLESYYDRIDDTYEVKAYIQGFLELVREPNLHYSKQLDEYLACIEVYDKKMLEYEEELAQYEQDVEMYHALNKSGLPVEGGISSEKIAEARRILIAAGITSL